MERLAVFCIADIPTATIDRLFQGIQDYLDEYVNSSDYREDASGSISIVNTKDPSTFTQSPPPTVTTCPTTFVGDGLEVVHDWFNENISHPCGDAFMLHCYLVLDDQSTQDDTCIFVCTHDTPPGEIQFIRCTFDVAMMNAVAVDLQGTTFDNDLMGCYMRAGVTMTKENYKLAIHGGLFIEGGYEVKVDEYWRDFSKY